MLSSEAIKTIAEVLSHVADDLNESKTLKGHYTDELAKLTDIINAEIEMPVKQSSKKEHAPKSKRDDRFYYGGIDCVDLDDDSRPSYNTITIDKGETRILEFTLSKSLKWVMKQDEKGNWVTVGKFILPKNKMQARMKLLKVARAEVEKPGSFMTEFVEIFGD